MLMFNYLAKNYQKFLLNAKFGPDRPKELCFFVLFCLCFFVLFCFLFFCFCMYFFSFFPFFFYSWPDLNLRLYLHNARFQFQKYKKFQLLRGHIPPRHPCVYASVQLTLTLHQLIPQCRRRMSVPVQLWCNSCCKMFGRQALE